LVYFFIGGYTVGFYDFLEGFGERVGGEVGRGWDWEMVNFLKEWNLDRLILILAVKIRGDFFLDGVHFSRWYPDISK
jgi:hypothetical protein